LSSGTCRNGRMFVCYFLLLLFGGDYTKHLLISSLLAVSHFQRYPLTLQSPFVSPTAAVTKDGQHSIQATWRQSESDNVEPQYLSFNNPLIQPLNFI
jgi:hypothetical protein